MHTPRTTATRREHTRRAGRAVNHRAGSVYGPRLDAATVKAAARGRWLSILPALAPPLADALAHLPRHVLCPVHGGRNGDGFRVFDDVAESGGGTCNTCGHFPGGLDLLGWANGWTFPETLAAVASFLGLAPGEAGAPRRPLPAPGPVRAPDPEKVRQEAEEEARQRARLRRLWQEARPDAPEALAYLRARGANLAALPSSIRWHPELSFWHECGGRRASLGTFPALLSLLVDGQREAVGLHRLYLDPARPAKASIPDPARPGSGELLDPKKVLALRRGACRGAVVRFGEPAEVVALTEGVENGAAIFAATGVSVLAAYCAGALGKVRLPAVVRVVELWPDFDPAGLRAAQEARTRFVALGLEVRIIDPARAVA